MLHKHLGLPKVDSQVSIIKIILENTNCSKQCAHYNTIYSIILSRIDLAFHLSLNGQKSVRPGVTLFYYLQAKHQISVKNSVKNNLMAIQLTILDIFVTNIVLHSAPYDILKIHPGNANYFDFSSPEIIAA